MSLICLLSLGLGWLLGGGRVEAGVALLVFPALCVMALASGAVIGAEGTLREALRSMGVRILLLPVMIALSSILCGGAAGLLVGAELNVGLAASAGFGWYSLPAAIVGRLGPAEDAALCFAAGFSREVAAFVLIPALARYLGPFEAIAPAGATAMDTALPLITRVAGSRAAVAAAITGFALTASAPVLVELLYTLG